MKPQFFIIPKKLKNLSFALIILLVLYASLTLKKVSQISPVSILPAPTVVPNITPTGLYVANYSPISPNPNIADTRTALNITFNQPLNKGDLTSLQINFIPRLSYKLKVNKDYKNIYLTPDLNWQDGKEYVLNIQSPQLSEQFIFKFTPTSIVDVSNVINDMEMHPKN